MTVVVQNRPIHVSREVEAQAETFWTAFQALPHELTSLPTSLVLPLTSQLEALRFPFTFRIDPSKGNGLSMPSVLLLFQMQVIDKRRVAQVIGKLEAEHAEQMNAVLRQMLTL